MIEQVRQISELFHDGQAEKAGTLPVKNYFESSFVRLLLRIMWSGIYDSKNTNLL